MTIEHAVSDVVGKTVISETLRLFVGHGRRISWADLALATGDDERKLRSYVEGATMPTPVMLRVFAVLPPEALGRVLRPIGFSVAPIDADGDRSLRHALSQAARFVADGNEALEDNTITPKEMADMADTAASLIPTLQVIAGGRSRP